MLSKVWAALKAPVNKAIDKAQATWPPNRIVVLLTPTVFVPVSAWLSGWAAANLPGIPPLSSGWIAGVMGIGALAALKLADKFIDGWQKHEARTAPKQATVNKTVTVNVEPTLAKTTRKAAGKAAAKK